MVVVVLVELLLLGEDVDSELQVMQQTLMLFDDSVGRVSPAHPPSPAPEVEDLECTDAPQLMCANCCGFLQYAD